VRKGTARWRFHVALCLRILGDGVPINAKAFADAVIAKEAVPSLPLPAALLHGRECENAHGLQCEAINGENIQSAPLTVVAAISQAAAGGEDDAKNSLTRLFAIRMRTQKP
jgi:hypothetical protein